MTDTKTTGPVGSDAATPMTADMMTPVASDGMPVAADSATPVTSNAMTASGLDAAAPMAGDATGPAGSNGTPVAADSAIPVTAGAAMSPTNATTITWVPVGRLFEHPANPNRMAGRLLKRLEDHIRRTGRYEPLVVRPHPSRAGGYQVINGHHRLAVLRRLGHRQAACVVWDVDDDETLVLLATLNRLAGRDDLPRKAELIAALGRRFDMADLAAMLPDSRSALERLRDMAGPNGPANDPGGPANGLDGPGGGPGRQGGYSARQGDGAVRGMGCGLAAEPFLHAVVFFLTDDEKRIVDDAIREAGRTIQDTPGRRRARVLVDWAREKTGHSQCNDSF